LHNRPPDIFLYAQTLLFLLAISICFNCKISFAAQPFACPQFELVSISYKFILIDWLIATHFTMHFSGSLSIANYSSDIEYLPSPQHAADLHLHQAIG